MINGDAAVRNLWKRFSLAIATALLGGALAGCETTSGLFGSSSDDSANAAAVAQAAPPPAPVPKTRISIAPVIGAPEGIAKQLSQQLGSSLEARQIGVAKAGEAADFTVRGYVVAAKDKSATKISYIWDVNDASGKRVNRVTGEESGPLSDRDPWAVVTANIVQAIAERAAGSLATSLPAAAAGSPIAAAAAPSAAGAQRTSATTTASIPQSQSGAVVAMVPSVTGAPGDGPQALSAAMQKELTRNGVQLAQGSSATAYRIEGKVQLGPSKSGTQPIQIEWQVKDPKGNKLGTVSQKNEIPQGSLDGAWGQTADVAAAAAAQGVIKLLPQTQTN